MKTFRENPEGEENQRASKENEREVFALLMQARANSPRVDKDGHCVHCYMFVSQCECWDSVNGGE